MALGEDRRSDVVVPSVPQMTAEGERDVRGQCFTPVELFMAQNSRDDTTKEL